MRFNFVLISCFLLVPAVLADKAGAWWDEDKGAFNYIVGSFFAPQLSGDPGSGISLWVAIDSGGCQTSDGGLTSGIVSTVTLNGTQHQGFLVWDPNSPLDFDITISTGDHIQITLNIIDPSRGSVSFVNLSNGQSVTKTFQASAALCGSEAEWMVGHGMTSGQQLSLAIFDSVSITGAAAGARGGSSYYPFGANLRVLYSGDEPGATHPAVTNTTAYSDGSLTVTYLGSQ
ncbi:peptidase G1 [Boletus edulis BED1]|uniref:Peptidase G1 n=1 Tax=Boletus edulis BED1 TaxID=1328754 RepID=A0AAD4GKX6_BOLED|nr:peptidase G1 [Boletus edulis BED1]